MPASPPRPGPTKRPDVPSSVDPGDETAIVVTTVAAAPRERVWEVLVEESPEWWHVPYLAPGAPPMHIQPFLGGLVTEGAAAAGRLHGTVRALDPPERLEIGGVLIAGAYAGTLTFTLFPTPLGTEIRVEQMARGRITEVVQEEVSDGWVRLLAELAINAEL